MTGTKAVTQQRRMGEMEDDEPFVRFFDGKFEILFKGDVKASGTILFDDAGCPWADFDTTVNRGHMSIVSALLAHLEELRCGIDVDKLERIH